MQEIAARDQKYRKANNHSRLLAFSVYLDVFRQY